MGLNKDLKLKGNDFSNAGSSFFISYLIAEVLYGFILNKVSASRVMTVTIILWGINSACMAAVTDYTTLIVARVFLGIFEGSISPCLSLIVSQWYTKSEQAPRFAIWYSGMGLGQVLGGVLSFAFQHVHVGFAGWRILFIVCGALTILLGIATYYVIPTSPMEAKFISDEEKAALLRHISSNKTGVVNHQFKASQLKEMLFDPQIWLLIIMTILVSVSGNKGKILRLHRY
jgi:MFS family permease